MLLLVEKPKKEQDTEIKLAGMGHGAFSHASPARNSDIHQKPTLLGPDPQNTSYCSTLDKIAIIEGMVLFNWCNSSAIKDSYNKNLVKIIQKPAIM